MATTSRPSNLFWSILVIFSAAIFFSASSQPPEVAESQRPLELATEMVKFHIWCLTMRNRNHTCYQWEINCREPDLTGCRYSYDEIQYRYEKTGYLSKDYVEALKVYHNYNRTDVDIEICRLARNRCPDRINALNAFCTSTEIKSGLYPYFC